MINLLKKIPLHLYGVRGFLKLTLKSGLQIVKAILILFVAMMVLNILSKGFGGFIIYLSSVEYWSLLREILVFVISISLIFLTFVVGRNFYFSITYCSKKKLSLSDFYDKENSEILKIWDGVGKK